MLMVYLFLFLSFEFLPSNSTTLIRIEWISYIVFINFLFFGLSMLSIAFPVYLNLYGYTDQNDPNGIKRLSFHHQSSSSMMRIICHKGHVKQITD